MCRIGTEVGPRRANLPVDTEDMYYGECVSGYGAFLPGPPLGILVVKVLGILHNFSARGMAACACASYSRLGVFVVCTLDAAGHCFFRIGATTVAL